MCQRHIPAGGGAAALAGTRRVALGAGWGGDGWYWSGGHWRDICLCGKNRKTRKHVLVSVLLFSFLIFFCFVFVFFALPCSSFLPLPRCERCELVYYTSKKEDEIETDTVSLYLRTSIMFCHLVSHTLVRSQFSSLSCFH